MLRMLLVQSAHQGVQNEQVLEANHEEVPSLYLDWLRQCCAQAR